MALVAACTLDPGIYFAMNSPSAVVTSDAVKAANIISNWGFPVTSSNMTSLARDLGESTLLGRAGGAPTLAVGMAKVFSSLVGGRHLMALWYHFAIMFEALFILTTVDAGTRVGRFLVQAALKQIHPSLGDTHSWAANLVSSALLVGGWGYFLYQGVIDPLGGINSLWPLFGIANQLLVVIALCLATTILLKMGKVRSCIATVLPLTWVTLVTFDAALQKVFSPNPKIGFMSAAKSLASQLAVRGITESNLAVVHRTQFNLRVDAVVASFFMLLVAAIVILSIRHWVGISTGERPRTLMESPIVRLSHEQLSNVPGRRYARSIQGVSLFVLGLLRQIAGESVGAEQVKPHLGNGPETQNAKQATGRAWVQRVKHRSSQPRCC